jgi:hypothetical protein
MPSDHTSPARKQKLLLLLREIENGLSPENLCRDGEASARWATVEGERLRKARQKVIEELGYTPTVAELYHAQ